MRRSKGIPMTPFDIALRYLGEKEIPGTKDNPAIMMFLQEDATWPDHDEVPWCSGFVNHCCRMTGTERTKSLRARTWLQIGEPVDWQHTNDLPFGYTVVILKRGGANQPGPDVINAQGHVGFLYGMSDTKVQVLGGNQNNQVSIAEYSRNRILGIRDLAPFMAQ